jgi:hypothetical protein
MHCDLFTGHHSKGRLLALLSVTNALAYTTAVLITAVKSGMLQPLVLFLKEDKSGDYHKEMRKIKSE